eukprot:1874315-Pyramimonas_sp.AAC.1
MSGAQIRFAIRADTRWLRENRDLGELICTRPFAHGHSVLECFPASVSDHAYSSAHCASCPGI